MSFYYGVELNIFIARAQVPQPAGIAFVLVGLLVFATYAADDLKRIGLWIVVGIGIAGIIGAVFYTYYLLQRQKAGLYFSDAEPPRNAYITGAAFASYLLTIVSLTVSRLRGSYDR